MWNLVHILKRRRCRLIVLVPFALVTFLVAGIILFKSTHHAIVHPPQPEIDPRAQACYDYIEHFTLTSRHENGTSRITSPTSRSKQRQRDRRLPRPLECLQDTGTRLVNEGLVNPTGYFSYPPQDFGRRPFLDNGWQWRGQYIDLPREWGEIFPFLEGAPSPAQRFHNYGVHQNGEFDNDDLDFIQPTHAEYIGYYIPEASLILMTNLRSPSHIVREEAISRRLDQISQGIQLGPWDPLQITLQVPRLHRLSDAVWEAWITDNPRPGTLRYYALNNIQNEPTAVLIDHLLWRDRGNAFLVPWRQRISFGLDSNEGRALLGTPCSVAVVWILVHRRGILGPRDPRVTIWNEGGSRRMIWEFIPMMGYSSFDDYEATSAYTVPA
ncbi:MAG: hypothetical protein Q9169_003816 [Polycauliona sp. 2 TL-2023]